MNVVVGAPTGPALDLPWSAVIYPRPTLLLATWLAPSFPIGGFAYSHGMEWAIVEGGVSDGPTAERWIADIFAHGAARTDAVVLAEAWRAGRGGDADRLRQAAALASALCASRERNIETLTLGTAFLAAVAAGWPSPELTAMAAPLDDSGAPYPIAVGVAAAAHDIPLEPTLGAFLNAQAQSLISVAIRLGAMGQTAGLRFLGGLQPVLLAQAAAAVRLSLDDLGSAAVGSDLASMRHESQYTRLFRT